MKRLPFVLLMLSILVFACNIPGPGQVTVIVVTATPQATEQPPETATPTETALPTATATQAVIPNVTCNNVSLYLDPALASSYNCETIPAQNGEDPWSKNPQYTKITLYGYVLGERYHDPRISVYPLVEYLALMPESSGRVDTLRSLIGGTAPGSTALPFLDFYGAAQEFHAQYGVIPFQNGHGIRYLTQYSQYCAPINNNEMIYTFQGLTSDEAYWISIVLPDSNPILPANADTFPGGVDQAHFCDVFNAYLTDIVNQLNAQSPSAFTPSLPALDALVDSIVIAL